MPHELRDLLDAKAPAALYQGRLHVDVDDPHWVLSAPGMLGQPRACFSFPSEAIECVKAMNAASVLGSRPDDMITALNDCAAALTHLLILKQSPERYTIEIREQAWRAAEDASASYAAALKASKAGR